MTSRAPSWLGQHHVGDGSRTRNPMSVPAESSRLERVPMWVAYPAAIIVPALTAFALIPFRDDIGASGALVLLLPVLAMALLGGSGPAIVAALSAAASFGVLLTQPYNQLAIHGTTDIVATVVLVVVGLVVGAMAQREHRSANRADERLIELEHVTAFAKLSARQLATDDLVTAAEDHLIALLHLERCDWSEAPRVTTHPLLMDDGQIMGFLHDLPADRSRLPDAGVELLVQTERAELGHFVLHPIPGSATSVEQRRMGATIADLLASSIDRNRTRSAAAAR